LAKASSESKEQVELTKKNAEKLFAENNRLNKQKQDLLTALRKQTQLIEILKKQKV
jgi:DNA gyrase/topoisomerase IV subunit A